MLLACCCKWPKKPFPYSEIYKCLLNMQMNGVQSASRFVQWILIMGQILWCFDICIGGWIRVWSALRSLSWVILDYGPYVRLLWYLCRWMNVVWNALRFGWSLIMGYVLRVCWDLCKQMNEGAPCAEIRVVGDP